MKSTNTLLALVFLLFSGQSISQITQLEGMSGLQKTDFTSLSIRPLTSSSEYSLGTLAFFQKYHQAKNQVFDEAGVQPTLYRRLTKRFSLGTGLYYNSIAGFSERISLLYSYHSKRLLIIAIPTVAHAEKSAKFNGELFMQMQYNQAIKKELKLFILTQLLTSWSQFSEHARSLQQIRLGLEKKATQFGLALDHDLYGSAPLRRTSVGIFIRKTFIIN